MGTELLTSLVISTIGAGYFIYGKKEAELWFMISGVALCFFPYVITGTELQLIVGAALMYLPFLAQRWE